MQLKSILMKTGAVSVLLQLIYFSVSVSHVTVQNNNR